MVGRRMVVRNNGWFNALRCDRRGGFSLLETAVVIVVLGVVMGGVTSFLLRSKIFSDEFIREGVVEETGWRATNRLTDEMYAVDINTLLPSIITDSAYIEFREVIGFTAGVPDLGNTIIIGWEPAQGESLNGSDDNGDGRIDEGFISRLDTGSTNVLGTYPDWSAYPGGNMIRLAGNVLGLRFNTITGGISYSVDIGLVDREGNVVQDTFTQQVAFRNK